MTCAGPPPACSARRRPWRHSAPPRAFRVSPRSPTRWRPDHMSDDIALLGDLLARARAAGADAADAVLVGGTSLGVQRRLGQTEHVERSEGRDLGLRVFLGNRSAIV